MLICPVVLSCCVGSLFLHQICSSSVCRSKTPRRCNIKKSTRTNETYVHFHITDNTSFYWWQESKFLLELQWRLAEIITWSALAVGTMTPAGAAATTKHRLKTTLGSNRSVRVFVYRLLLIKPPSLFSYIVRSSFLFISKSKCRELLSSLFPSSCRKIIFLELKIGRIVMYINNAIFRTHVQNKVNVIWIIHSQLWSIDNIWPSIFKHFYFVTHLNVVKFFCHAKIPISDRI